jgi:hypothetical protein
METAKLATNQESINEVMHFHEMFKKFVKPVMETKYAKENKGKKLGFHVIDKDGIEKLFDDIIIENASAKGTDGTK